MGEAKRRRQRLGDLYGTPEGSNRPLIAYKGFDQAELDQKALAKIRTALAAGKPVILIGTKDARPLAEAAGLPWLHETPAGAPIPPSLAWDPQIAEAGGPMLSPSHCEGALLIFGAGINELMTAAMANPQG